LLDHGQGYAGCGVVALKSTFCELEHECYGCRDLALDAAFTDGHHLAQNGCIGRFAMTLPRTTGGIAASAL
jgi:hypothetical protein